ncbi:hypothetical protein IMCC3088_310 [Aequoribacter fuscus]|uniref:Uncharacterized protein n=1 Tax=Aequoribacter fuscus TaxID=2518989 RepID=F3L5N0_9GAMM|nr:hypothetical protein IMCC3088_310 [Aequoribacter fuscus]
MFGWRLVLRLNEGLLPLLFNKSLIGVAAITLSYFVYKML